MNCGLGGYCKPLLDLFRSIWDDLGTSSRNETFLIFDCLHERHHKKYSLNVSFDKSRDPVLHFTKTHLILNVWLWIKPVGDSGRG